MAAKPETEVDAEGAAKKPAKGKKMLLIALVLVILAGAAGGGWLYLSRQKPLDEGEEEVVATKAESKHPPVTMPLDVMVVNLADPGGDRVAQVGVTLELSDPKAPEKIKPYVPAIRNSVLMRVSDKKAEELLTREGKERLAEEILADAAGLFESGSDKNQKKDKDRPENPVKRVFFSSFIVQ